MTKIAFFKPRRLAMAALSLAAFCTSLFAFPVVPAQAQKGGKGGGKDGGGGTNGVIIKSNEKFLAAFKDVVAKAGASTVRVQCEEKDVALGVVVSADGYILTKFSDLTDKITVKTRDGMAHEAKLVGVQQIHDLAMLKIQADDLTPVSWKDSKATPAGHWVASPGPAGDAVAVGVVSVPTRNVPGAKGPLAVPAAPNPNSGYLGIGLEDGDIPGAKISRVEDKSAAQKAGIKVNDHIVAVAGKEITNAETLVQTIGRFKAGETVELKIKRGDEELELKATLGKRPANQPGNRGDFQNNLGSELSKRRSGWPTILQHDQVILPKDCGGPLVDLDGNVIGINVARAGRVESYAVPSEIIQPFLRDLMDGKLPPPSASKKEKEKEKEKDKDK